jgi:hypothetical protein
MQEDSLSDNQTGRDLAGQVPAFGPNHQEASPYRAVLQDKHETLPLSSRPRRPLYCGVNTSTGSDLLRLSI